MNHYISGIIKIMILEAGAALLLFDRFLAGRFERQRKVGFAVLAGLMVFAWCEYGSFRVHHWEQFHFYLGAKYQKEVGWFDLYKAALIADREPDGPHVLGTVTETRDLTNFEVVKVEQALADAGRVRAQFSDERWSAFKEDLRRFSALVPWWQQPGRDGRTSWQAMMLDHGNSNSPAWAVFAHPIASVLPLTAGNLALIGALDMLLMIALWAAAYRVFGIRLASIGLLIWATAPNSYWRITTNYAAVDKGITSVNGLPNIGDIHTFNTPSQTFMRRIVISKKNGLPRHYIKLDNNCAAFKICTRADGAECDRTPLCILEAPPKCEGK